MSEYGLTRDLKGRYLSEGQLLFDFMKIDSEYAERCVEQVLTRLVESRIEERRDELERRIDNAIKEALINVASQEFFQVVMRSEGSRRHVKPLADEVQERARKHVANLMRIQFDTTMELKRKVERLEERINRDDSDWWKRGESCPDEEV